MNNLQEFLKDVREHPDSFKGLHYPTLLKAIKDIENQSLKHKLSENWFLDQQYNPKYLLNVMELQLPGFKDTCGPKLIPAVVFDIDKRSSLVERLQLAIHASANRSVQLGIRVKYRGHSRYVFYPCRTNEVMERLKFIFR